MKWIISLRFISLVAHLVLVILFISNRDYNVRLCLSWNHSDKEYWSKDYELVVGLSLSIVLLILELLSFITGITMIHAKQTLFSFCIHTFGTITLTSFIMDGWECQLFWWLFTITIFVPFLTESIIMIHTILLLYNTNLTYR
ncbi:transmembrane protein 107 [Dermatophagoides farinae]|uniref:transmembrane protein 107 n=1 Tax=Dermatophagoides farinae TaxID=6954 RepID=UPI003F61E9AB